MTYSFDYFGNINTKLYHSSWERFFQKETQKAYFKELDSFLKSEEQKGKPLYPPKLLIFNAFFQVPLSEVKVVIIGQDPYHGCGQAHGLSFSVAQGVTPPPSLKNIFKELADDLHLKTPKHGCLLGWAHQGVLLLNATLTVREGEPKSHYGRGWEIFTDHVIKEISLQDRPLVFLLWGKSAQEKCLHLLEGDTNNKHLILKTTHPSPFSAHYGFLGSKHFSQTNAFLIKNGVQPIDWSLN